MGILKEGGVKIGRVGMCCGGERFCGLIRVGLAEDRTNLCSQSTVREGETIKHDQERDQERNHGMASRYTFPPRGKSMQPLQGTVHVSGSAQDYTP